MSIDATPRASCYMPNDNFYDRVYLTLMLAIFLSVPFIVGDQPQGAESLNPVKALESVGAEGDRSKQILMFLFYFGSFVMLLRRARLKMTLFLGTPLVLLTGWCAVTALWSFDPAITVRRSVALIGSVILGAYMGLRFGLRTILHILVCVTWIVLISSVIIAYLWPADGLDFEGRLRGVFAHKNGVSGFASIGILVITARLIDWDYTSLSGPAADAILICICCVCMWWAQSAGAVPFLALSLPLLPLTRFLRAADSGFLSIIPIMACVLTAALALALGNIEYILSLLGKSTDMSGRSQVWDYAFRMFLERPWLGYGFGTFWEGPNSPGAAFWNISNLGVPHSHNGYLQLALDAGVIGVALFGFALAGLVFKLTWLIRYGNDPIINWFVAFLALFLVGNVIENSVVDRQ